MSYSLKSHWYWFTSYYVSIPNLFVMHSPPPRPQKKKKKKSKHNLFVWIQETFPPVERRCNTKLEVYSPEYLEQLINLRVPRKQWSLIHHLSKYTPHWPHINRGRVMTGSKQYFWCSVPEGHHLDRTRKIINQRSKSWP